MRAAWLGLLAVPLLSAAAEGQAFGYGSLSYATGFPFAMRDIPASLNGFWVSGSTPSLQFHTYGGGVPNFYANELLQFSSIQSDAFETGLEINFQANSGYVPSNTSFTNGKSGMLISGEATANAGHVWAQSNDLVIDSGWQTANFGVNTEFDITNNSAVDTTPVTGTTNVFDLFVGGSIGNSPITAGIFYGPIGNNTNYAAHWGLGFVGAYSVKDATIIDGTSSTYSYEDDGGHTVGIYLNGQYSLAPVVGTNFNIDTLGHFNTTSDERLKTNISVISDAEDKIEHLHGYTYTRKDTGKADIGVIAQEVETEFPEAVSQCGAYKCVNYAALIAPLIEANRELAKRVAALEARGK